MEASLQRRVQRYGWDAAAALYEDAWRDNLRPAHDLMFAIAEPSAGERVADIASGSGLLAFRAAEAVGKAGCVIATDISDAMVGLIRDTAARQGAENITASRCDAERLDLQTEYFDIAMCALGLMYVPEPQGAIDEMHRILKPGGRAACAVWGARKNCGWAEIFPIVDAVVQSEVCPMFFHLGNGDVLATMMAQAGFQDVETRRLDVTLNHESGADALTAVLDGGPVALAVKRFDGPKRSKVEAEYLASIDPYGEGEGAYRIPGEFVVAVGKKPDHAEAKR